MSDWLLSALWYNSILAVLVGVIACLRPVRWLRLSSRWRGLGLMVVSVGLVLANARCAPRSTSVDSPTTALDANVPVYHFREVHTRVIDASPARVLAAIKNVTANEIALFSLFTAIRRFGRPSPESILNAPGSKPILDVATSTGFLLLADDAREVVLGTIVATPPGFKPEQTPDAQWFRALSQPGVAKAAMNFFVTPETETRTRVRTETRVVGTDASAIRRFTPYWRTIFPGSWILRVTWLQAIERRAES